MRPYIKHLYSEAVRLFKNTLYLSYKREYNEQRTRVLSLQKQNLQLMKRNVELLNQIDHLTK